MVGGLKGENITFIDFGCGAQAFRILGSPVARRPNRAAKTRVLAARRRGAPPKCAGRRCAEWASPAATHQPGNLADQREISREIGNSPGNPCPGECGCSSGKLAGGLPGFHIPGRAPANLPGNGARGNSPAKSPGNPAWRAAIPGEITGKWRGIWREIRAPIRILSVKVGLSAWRRGGATRPGPNASRRGTHAAPPFRRRSSTQWSVAAEISPMSRAGGAAESAPRLGRWET